MAAVDREKSRESHKKKERRILERISKTSHSINPNQVSIPILSSVCIVWIHLEDLNLKSPLFSSLILYARENEYHFQCDA